MNLLQVYLLEINMVALILGTVDKIRARTGKWRVPEGTLLLSAALGGAAGLLLTMLLLRHKTKHKKFILGVPAILLAQVALLLLLK
jgi:uncharacterized membrane protein YsdA (DUF1294 family)